MKSSLAFIAFVFCLAFSAAGQEAVEDAGPIPVPDSGAQADALKVVKEVYGAEWTAVKTTAQKLALSKKLMQRGRESDGDKPAQFVLMQLARDVASQTPDVASAFESITELEKRFRIKAVEMRLEALTKIAAASSTADMHKAATQKAFEVADEAIVKGKYSVAKQIVDLAIIEARKSGDVALVKQALERKPKVDGLAKAFEEAKAALDVLSKSPADPSANFTVGKYYCFAEGNWAIGLPMLVTSEDAALKPLAEAELKVPTTPEDQVKLADRWWELSEAPGQSGKKQIQSHAAYWYRLALPGLTGLAKEKTEKRLRDANILEWWRGWTFVNATATEGIVKLNRKEARISSPQNYSGALDIVVVARTDSKNIRLVYGDATKPDWTRVMWNWEVKPEELRVRRFSGTVGTAKVVPLQPNTWYKLRWIIKHDGMAIYVNDKLIFSEKQNNTLSESLPVMIHNGDSVVEVKSVDITPLPGGAKR